MKVTKKLISLALTAAMIATGFSLAAGSAEVIDPTDYMGESWTVYDHYGTNWDGSVNDDLHPYQAADNSYSDGKRVQGYFTDVMSGNDLLVCHNFDRHIMVKGDANSSSVMFAGYGRDAMADFMIYHSASSAKKVVSFDLDFARIDAHTLSGSMIFVNAQIENGTLDGYIIYFPANKGSSVQLLKASQVNAAAMSAGLATTGKIPFVVTYAVFGSLRMCEMIRQEICYTNLNVKIACSHGGLTPANDGASHQAIEDMGVLRTIPNMTVIQPADYVSAKKLVRAAAETYGPMFLRFTRDAVPVIYDEGAEFTIGKAVKLREGKDVAIIAVGDTVRLALEAAAALHEQGVEARVLDMHTIKPLDTGAVNACIADIGKIVTVEDHNIINALGSAVCECVAEAGNGIVRRIGVQDQFGESAPYERLLAKNGITTENIVAQAKSLL